jgi:hypothetical protein
MRRGLTTHVLTGILVVGCRSVEGDTPAGEVYGTDVIRWASASSGPDILLVGGPSGAAPRCIRTLYPAQANMGMDGPPSFNGISGFPDDAYAAVDALFTDEVEAVLRGDSDRLRARPPADVHPGSFLDLEHTPLPPRTRLDVRLPVDETASSVTLELLAKLLPLLDAHCPHP